MAKQGSIETDSFSVTERNRVRREHHKGHYDRETVYGVLDSAMLCHVAYAIADQPYCTPTLFWREGDVLYWHGSSASRMLRHLKGGARACLSVTHMDGLVLARSAFNHSVNYRSAMCFGTAECLDDPSAKAAALHRMMERYYPGRDAQLRSMTDQEIKATSVLFMTIEDASAKVRQGGPNDPATDLDHPVWAGVIPFETRTGAEIPSPDLKPNAPQQSGLKAYQDGVTLHQALRDLT